MSTGIPPVSCSSWTAGGPPPRRAALVVNGRARRGEEWFGRAKQLLVEGGIDLVGARDVRSPKDVPGTVAKHVQDEVPLVIVGGGDGTFSAIAHILARSASVLGVLPLGTGNSFARDLGIPPDIDAACGAILNGTIARVDMGAIGDRHFLNVATLGLSTQIALGLDDGLKRRLGRAVYLVSLLKAIATVRPFHATLDLPSGTDDFDCLQLVIGNGRFHAGPFPVTPDANITGGWLAIYALASRRKAAFLKLAMHLRGGKHVDLAEVRSFRTHSGRLSTAPAQRVTVDGEACLRTPVDFAVAANALAVVVPPGFTGH